MQEWISDPTGLLLAQCFPSRLFQKNALLYVILDDLYHKVGTRAERCLHYFVGLPGFGQNTGK